MSLEQARQYLARVLPWPQEGEEPAFINIHWTFEPTDRPANGKGYPWSGKACRSLNEAINAIRWAQSLPGTRDIYACMSSQRASIETVSQKGNVWHKALRNQPNAVALKSLFLDIDFKGGEHGYDTQDEAIQALAGFIKSTGLPKPSILVLSGGGVHCYWTLARSLALDEWRPLAYALAEATKQLGLRCDSQCTVDGARVLRVPGTFNRKLEAPRPVALAGDSGLDYAVERIAQALEPYRVAAPRDMSVGSGGSGLVPLDHTIFPPRPPLEDVDDLGAGIEKVDYPPIKLKDVALACPFVRDAILTGGRTYSQPEWNLSTLLSTFTEEGRKAAHLMGNKHPDYTQESTDAMYDRKDRERQEKGLGWPSCASISAAGCKACQTCPHYAAGKTPIHAALRAPAPVGAVGVGVPNAGATLPQVTPGVSNIIPHGYQRDPNSGIIFKLVTKPDGETETLRLCDYSMEDGFIQEDPECLNFQSKIGRTRRAIYIPLKDVGGQGMRAHLQAQGFMLPHGEKGQSSVATFMNAWIKVLRETHESVKSYPFGWNDRHDMRPGFVFASKIWSAGPPTPAAPVEPALRRAYDPVGTPDAWHELSKITAAQRRPGLDVILASAFAAPLVRFSGQSGCIISMVGRSAAGKTTTARLAQAVWGHPKLAMQGLEDTRNSAGGVMGKIRSLPFYWDEIKDTVSMQALVQIIFNTTRGREKGRMGRDLQLREPGQWQTLFLTCNNTSLLEFIASNTKNTNAGVMRLLELHVAKVAETAPGRVVPSDVARLDNDLERNHGWIGVQYAQFLGAHQDDISKELGALMKQLHKEYDAPSEERFWVATIGSLLLGAKYANDLGFTDIDLPMMKAYLSSGLTEMRNRVAALPNDMDKEINLSTIIADFYRDSGSEHTCFTNYCHSGRGKPSNITIDASRTDMQRLKAVWVHIGTQDRIMRVSHTCMKRWLEQRHFDCSMIFKAMKDEYKAEYKQAKLCAGTKLNLMPEWIYEINLRNAPTLDIL